MINKNRVAVLGVVFSEVERFIDEYLTSLYKQTFKNFDLIIINDEFSKFSIYKYKYYLNIREISYRGTPAEIREFGINYIINEGYEYIIFTDTDDYFSINRIEKSIELLKYYDIVVNDLTTVSNRSNILESQYISKRLENLSKINLDFIIDKNIFGLSNTAIKTKCLNGNISFARNLIAVDWYLFSKLLKNGFSAIFNNEAVTFYRIYEGNIIGLSSGINTKKIEKGIDVKLYHYKELSKIDNRFIYLYTKFNELKNKIKKNEYKKKYIEKIKQLNVDIPFWWEEIKLPEGLN